MAKKIKTSRMTPDSGENKLALVPASGLATPLCTALAAPADLSKFGKLKKLTLPPLYKPESVPVGSMISGKLVAVVESISTRDDMRNQKLLRMIHENGEEFLFPLTGTVKKSLGGFEGAEEKIGQTLLIVRRPDGETTKYSGKDEPAKKMYMFDIFLAESE